MTGVHAASKSRRYWSDTESSLVREGFGKPSIMVSCKKLGKRLDRTAASVHQHARILGLTTIGRTRTHIWTDEESQILRRDILPSRAERTQLANRLGVTFSQVTHQAARLGLLKATDYGKRIWTHREDRILRQYVARESTVKIAKRLNRTINSVTVRMKVMGLKRRARDDWYTKTDVCALFGIGHRWVQRRIDSGALKATYHYDERPSRDAGLTAWHIEASDLCSFIRKYSYELNGRNVDLLGIVDLLVGVEH